MIRIDENGEVLINGQNINKLTNQTNSKTIKKTIVIKNGKVVQNDFADNEEDFDMENFHNDFIDKMGPAFQNLKKSTKIKCDYCGSVYKSSKTECPNCGANNGSI